MYFNHIYLIILDDEFPIEIDYIYKIVIFKIVTIQFNEVAVDCIII